MKPPMIIWLLLAPAIHAKYLLPPIFNLAEKARISATSTCGEEAAESFAMLTESKRGIVTGICIPQNSSSMYSIGKVHSAHYALDNSKRYWQSPSLAKGEQYHEVNLTVDLGREYSVMMIEIVMANSPRPKLWALEWSRDHGKTWSASEYFAENDTECEKYFGELNSETSCVTMYSEAKPYADGNILLLTQCALNCSLNLDLYCSATNIRFRFLRMHTDWPENREIESDDRYFYAVKQIEIVGTCACNGHTTQCYEGVCQECQHNTCGDQCERCCRGYYRPEGVGKSEPCQSCNCRRAGSFQTGVCSKDGQCFCKPGWEGKQCEKHTHKIFYSDEELANWYGNELE